MDDLKPDYIHTIMADSEALILVDEQDRRVGHMSKSLCHQGQGVLHRAFSVLIFNDRGELLVQQRASGKRLWPLFWSNSCCSHPRGTESVDEAARRRLYEELGMESELKFLFKFQYHAQFDANGAERELCWVFIGRSTRPPRIDRDEIHAWRWVSPAVLQAEMSSAHRSKYTPWFLIEWERVWRDHRAAVLALQGPEERAGGGRPLMSQS